MSSLPAAVQPAAAVEVVPESFAGMANAVRALSIDAVETARSGHPGLPLGAADLATVLFSRFLKFDPADPAWPDRDRFVLSAGHGSALLYSLLHLTGYEAFPLEALKRFRQLGSPAAGHPEYDPAHGIETTTGPLGQGFANAVGMALAERIMNARFGSELVDHRTYVLASDGDLMEGISHEAASLAGHLRLGRLIVLFDDNGISIDGATDLATSDDTVARFRAYGWSVEAVDGHDPEAVTAALERAQTSAIPSLICCRTVIGFGAPTKAGTAASHGAPLGPGEMEATRTALGWTHPPFEVPGEIRDRWRAPGRAGAARRADWQARLDAAPRETREAFLAAVNRTVPGAVDAEIGRYKQELAAEAPKLATRQSSGEVIARLMPVFPELVGGSADLTGSNLTKPKGPGAAAVTAAEYGGQYVHYGVREHAMGAIVNGLWQHGGVVPFGATFLVFADYFRPSLRLAALMGLGVIHVLTHDSIGLGEDGPTHQPVEHLASLRAIPRLQVFRPADAVEVAECWQAALATPDRPSVLALSRQGIQTIRQTHTAENLSARGGYVIADADDPRVTLIATGSEVTIALEAKALLADQGIAARVVSMPCWERFDAQDAAYRRQVIDPATTLVAVEAGLRQGWDKYIGSDGLFIGMESFGASAPAMTLYDHFGITAKAVASAVAVGFK
jgi:transketolase